MQDAVSQSAPERHSSASFHGASCLSNVSSFEVRKSQGVVQTGCQFANDAYTEKRSKNSSFPRVLFSALSAPIKAPPRKPTAFLRLFNNIPPVIILCCSSSPLRTFAFKVHGPNIFLRHAAFIAKSAHAGLFTLQFSFSATQSRRFDWAFTTPSPCLMDITPLHVFALPASI